MASVKDVAEFILKEYGSMPAMKLQKLVYYCQAWSLVWDDAPLFNETIEAWANGPVSRVLFEAHKGKFKVDTIKGGNFKALTPNQKDTIQKVLKFYADKSSQWLSDLTHMEAPWINARREGGLTDSERGSTVITHEEMHNYYSNL